MKTRSNGWGEQRTNAFTSKGTADGEALRMDWGEAADLNGAGESVAARGGTGLLELAAAACCSRVAAEPEELLLLPPRLLEVVAEPWESLPVVDLPVVLPLAL
jgi:hypothetical protein